MRLRLNTHSQDSRFWAKVDKSDLRGCWLWLGVKNDVGYGFFRVQHGKPMASVHRLSWKWANGDIPEGKAVLHTCDVRHCVNPAHLWLGTQLENIEDRDTKGRNNGLVHLLELNKRGGPRLGRPNLNPAQVQHIRESVAAGTSRYTLAEQYETSYEAISNIVNGRTYRYAVA